MSAFSRDRLRRRIQHDGRGLAPSIELPWAPPWSDELGDELVSLLADVAVVQADVADERTWHEDATGAMRRTGVVDECERLAGAASTQSFGATAHALTQIAASIRAWEALQTQR